MQLSQLNYFKVVATHEHISHAAEELHIAQPALSATVSKLEKELGVALFDRTGRNIVLNENGRKLLTYVDFIYNSIQDMEETLTKIQTVWENEFTFAVNNSTLLNGWLQQFILQNPEIRLRQKMMSETQMTKALLNESIDIALGEFAADYREELTYKVLLEDEYVITIPVEHPLAHKEKIYFNDICNEDLIALSSSAIVRIADRVFMQMGARPNIVFEGNQRTMAKMVRANKGLLFDSRQMVYMNYLRSKETATQDKANIYHVIMQPIVDMDCTYKLSLCYKKDRRLPLAAQNFITAMESTYPCHKVDKEYQRQKDLYLTIN